MHPFAGTLFTGDALAAKVERFLLSGEYTATQTGLGAVPIRLLKVPHHGSCKYEPGHPSSAALHRDKRGNRTSARM